MDALTSTILINWVLPAVASVAATAIAEASRRWIKHDISQKRVDRMAKGIERFARAVAQSDDPVETLRARALEYARRQFAETIKAERLGETELGNFAEMAIREAKTALKVR